jgi:anti-anti-sigma factor
MDSHSDKDEPDGPGKAGSDTQGASRRKGHGRPRWIGARVGMTRHKGHGGPAPIVPPGPAASGDGEQTLGVRAFDLRWPAEPLSVRSHRDGHWHVLQLIGELDGHGAAALEDELRRVERSDAQKIIVDLGAVTSIGSAALKVFIHANTRSREDGNRLTLLPGPDHVQQTFETTGLLSRLPFVSADDAKPLVNGHLATVHVILTRPVHHWRH